TPGACLVPAARCGQNVFSRQHPRKARSTRTPNSCPGCLTDAWPGAGDPAPALGAPGRGGWDSTPVEGDVVEDRRAGRVGGGKDGGVLQVAARGAGDGTAVANRGPRRPAAVGRRRIAAARLHDERRTGRETGRPGSDTPGGDAAGVEHHGGE